MTKLTSDFFRVVDATPLVPREEGPAFATGDAFRVDELNGFFRLSYLSGEHYGREKTLEISQAEAHDLRDGATTLDFVLIAHEAS